MHVKEVLLKKLMASGASLKSKSHGLIIHCHGGGFVAQSSASHQVSTHKRSTPTQTPTDRLRIN